jgi:hypothetical protein
MLKTIALAGIFLFSSAISTAAVTKTSSKKVSTTETAPVPSPTKGFCTPAGSKC